MSPSTRRRINAIVKRHLDYYDRFPYTKPKLVIHYSNPGAPWSLGSNSGAERGMFDPDLDAVNPRAGRRAGHHR